MLWNIQILPDMYIIGLYCIHQGQCTLRGMDRTGRLCSHLRGGMLPVFRILPSAKTHNKKMDAMSNGKKIF